MFAGTKSGIFRSVNPVISINDKKNNPLTFFLKQNYPNPFNLATNIYYSIKETGFVSLKVFDVLGREVKILVNEFENAGNYKVIFNGEDLPSGIYFYRLESSEHSATKKMLLLK